MRQHCDSAVARDGSKRAYEQRAWTERAAVPSPEVDDGPDGHRIAGADRGSRADIARASAGRRAQGHEAVRRMGGAVGQGDGAGVDANSRDETGLHALPVGPLLRSAVQRGFDRRRSGTARRTERLLRTDALSGTAIARL